MHCSKCGNELASTVAKFCNKCGQAQAASSPSVWPQTTSTPPVAPIHRPSPLDAAQPSVYDTAISTSRMAISAPAGYEATFRRFDAANGGFLWTWNWSAFLAGPLWCFAKGLWKSGILFILVAILTGVGWFIIPIVVGITGNWLFYQTQRHGSEPWYDSRPNYAWISGTTVSALLSLIVMGGLFPFIESRHTQPEAYEAITGFLLVVGAVGVVSSVRSLLHQNIVNRIVGVLGALINGSSVIISVWFVNLAVTHHP